MSAPGGEGRDRLYAYFLEVPGPGHLCIRRGCGGIHVSVHRGTDSRETPFECDEGQLEWVAKDAVWGMEIWEGDKIFFRLLDEERDFFSLKLVYDTEDVLQYASLDGVPMELFDERNPDGTKTGVVKERGVAHREGALHATVPYLDSETQ